MDLQSLTLLANMLAHKYNVDVRAEGTAAHCAYDSRSNKTTITVPAFTLDNDAQRVYVRGYIDHEIGHARFTNWSDAPDMTNNTLRSIVNILEDVYVERRMGQCYPGCALNLKAMQHQLFEVDLSFEKFNTSEHCTTLGREEYWKTMRYILYRARNVQSMVGFAKDDLELVFPGMPDMLEPFMQKIPLCRNSKDNTELGKAIYEALLKYWNDNANQQPQTDDGQQGDDQGDDASDSDGDSQSGGESKEQTADSGKQSARPDSTICKHVRDTAELNCNITAIVRDMLAQAIENAIDKIDRGTTAQCPVARIRAMESKGDIGMVAPMPNDMKSEAAGCAAALSAQLQALMQAKALRKRSIGMCGRLDSTRLHRIALNNPRVFLKNTEVRQVNTQVLVLCDASGSMTCDRKDELTSKAVYALMKSLRNIHGVKSGAYMFGGNMYASMLGFDTPLHKGKMHLCGCTGGTPGGSALQRALAEFDLMRDDRKIVIFLTDGDFDRGERDVFRAVYKETQAAGIDVIGVGIRSDAVRSLWKDGDFFYIENLKELAPKLFEILKARMV